MAEEAELKPCSNPGCDQPGTKSCSACKSSVYCSVLCQTADWPSHKEECDGHLRKVGNANLEKAKGFQHQQNWIQTLRYGEIAATKLKKLKDRRLETVILINNALSYKFNALNFMDRHKEAKECVEENYTLWAMNHMRNSGSIGAALNLIQSCIHNKEFEDAEHYARHAMFMINEMTDNFIPSDQRSMFLADGSYYLATAIFNLARAGGIPPEQEQKAGKEAIELARQALELRTQLHGIESAKDAMVMGLLAGTLDYFNDVDDDVVLRLHEQSIDVYRRMEGTSSVNVGVAKKFLGTVYINRGRRAHAANDLDRCMVNYDLALPHIIDAARIFRAVNRMGLADHALRVVAQIEEDIRQIRIANEAAAKVVAAATRG